MKIVRILFLLILSGAWLAPTALAAKHQGPNDFRLFGMWEAYEPESGVVRFDMNQTMRIYLNKEEGSRLNLRYFDAPFTLVGNNTLKLRYVLNRKRHYRSIKLSFQSDDELWLTENGRVTKYRRLRGRTSTSGNSAAGIDQSTKHGHIMKSIRILLALALSCVFLAPAALAADELSAAEKRLVGVWQEYEPASNVVQFFPDRTMRIYLTKEERDQMRANFIPATWVVSPDNMLSLTFTGKNGKGFTQTIKLEYKGKEMWLVDEKRPTTKHHRLKGAEDIPAIYKW